LIAHHPERSGSNGCIRYGLLPVFCADDWRFVGGRHAARREPVATGCPGLAQMVSASKFRDLIGRDATQPGVLKSMDRQELQERPAARHRPPNEPLNAVDRSLADCCPYCRSPFEIVAVKFRLTSVAIVASCPNCGMASPDEPHAAQSRKRDNTKEPRKPLNPRLKYALTLLPAATITAAALRHGVHVYGGISREEIRAGALMAIPVVALAIFFFRRKRRAAAPRHLSGSLTPEGRSRLHAASREGTADQVEAVRPQDAARYEEDRAPEHLG